MVSIARSEGPLDLPLSLDEERVLLAALRATAGFLLSALFVIFVVLSVHAFEADHVTSPGPAATGGVNGSFLTSDL